MNLSAKISFLAFTLLAGGGLLLQSCTTPLLKPKAAAKAGACSLGNALAGSFTVRFEPLSGEFHETTAGRPDVVDMSECNPETGSRDAVYKLEVEQSVGIDLEVCSEDVGYIVMTIWRGCPSDGDLVGCAMENCIEETYCLSTGTYYIAVEGYGLGPDDGVIDIWWQTNPCI